MTEGSRIEGKKKGTEPCGKPICIGEGAVEWESMETDCDRSVRYEVSMRRARPVRPKVEESLVRRS